MGARVCVLARNDPRFELVAKIDREATAGAAATVQPCDAFIDFSSDQGTLRAIGMAMDCRASILVGTTGLSLQTQEAIEVAARRVAVMVAPNTSLGVAVLAQLAARAARLLGDEFDVNLIETHHAAKRDAPSGTALRIAEVLREAGATLPPESLHAIRGGDVVGEHTVEFAGPGERLRLCHLATSRDIFAAGALRATAWLCGQPPGRYGIEQAWSLAD